MFKMRPPEYVLGGTELRTSLYSEVRNWSTSLFTKQTLGISDFHFKVDVPVCMLRTCFCHLPNEGPRMARSLLLSLSNAVWYEALILWTELKMPIAVNKVSTRLAFLMRSRNIIFHNNFSTPQNVWKHMHFCPKSKFSTWHEAESKLENSTTPKPNATFFKFRLHRPVRPL